jgi:hypothetical protein
MTFINIVAANTPSISLALVAQWLEHWSYEPGVGGSNPPLSNPFCDVFHVVQYRYQG